MFYFLENEVKQRIYDLQQESEKQRLLQKKKDSRSTKQSISTIKSTKKPLPVMSMK